MAKQYSFELDDLDLGQLLDGLEARAASWEKTAVYLRTAEMADREFFLIEECSDAEEADGIAEHYRAIIGRIQSQMEAQS